MAARILRSGSGLARVWEIKRTGLSTTATPSSRSSPSIFRPRARRRLRCCLSRPEESHKSVGRAFAVRTEGRPETARLQMERRQRRKTAVVVRRRRRSGGGRRDRLPQNGTLLARYRSAATDAHRTHPLLGLSVTGTASTSVLAQRSLYSPRPRWQDRCHKGS